MLNDLKVKIFADGADISGMKEMLARPYVRGFTTNPTLMRKAGVADYRQFAMDVLTAIPDLPISFEVLSDDLPEMEQQALEISSWGDNVYVKIPVTTTTGQSTAKLIRHLADRGVKQNVTALMTLEQVKEVSESLNDGPSSYISVFAGRIADSGVDPVPLMTQAVKIISSHSRQELIWASPREVLNIVQADKAGCQIITVTNQLLNKLDNLGKSLEEFSLETVRMFYNDAQAAGYSL